MYLIDMHSDTFYRMKECSTKQNIIKNKLHIDLEKLKEARSFIQCFALYSDMEACMNKGLDPWDYILELYAMAKEEIENTNGLLQVAHTVEEAIQIHKAGNLAAFLTIEDGGILQGDMNRLNILHKMGIRMMSLTWNYSNCIGHGNEKATRDLGLTSFGKDLVAHMNELGMVVDVSHLSDGGFWDVLDVSNKPIVASHSNARAILPHERNLTDKMIKAIGNNGGVMGLNFCPYFVADKGEHLFADDLAVHVKHMIHTGGLESVAIGTDFDGMNGILEIEHIGQIEKLAHALTRVGLDSKSIEYVFYKNAKRVFEDVLK